MRQSYLQPTVYCDILEIDVGLFSKEVRDLMEDEMKIQVRKKVLAAHPYKLEVKRYSFHIVSCTAHSKNSAKKLE